jgi:hypothetical protein
LNFEKKHAIHASLIYDTKIGPILKKIEAEAGYDDLVNLALYLLHEIDNSNSQWKSYLDLLPRQPSTIIYDYQNRKYFVEDQLKGAPILSKYYFIFTYYLLLFRENNRL